MSTPTISIVTATYNCSHWLKFAIRSVLNNTYQEWEMIIVGDHCTDDTEAVVATFDDPRISFFNLSENTGQQATPNNFGVQRARGRYLCFLNQDDMFMFWHLGLMLEQIEQTGADILLAKAAVIEPFEPGGDEVTLSVLKNIYRVSDSEYSPRFGYLASRWFMSTDTARSVGPWKTEGKTYVTPSQEWLFRAWCLRKRIVGVPRLSVIMMHSGARVNSYRTRDDSEHQYLFDNVVAGEDRRPEIENQLGKEKLAKSGDKALYHRLVDTYFATLGKVLMTCGIHPRIPILIARYGFRRGGFVRHWTEKTGAGQ